MYSLYSSIKGIKIRLLYTEKNNSINFTQLSAKLGHILTSWRLLNIIVIICDVLNVEKCITVR